MQCLMPLIHQESPGHHYSYDYVTTKAAITTAAGAALAAASAAASAAGASLEKEGRPEDFEDAHLVWLRVQFCLPHYIS